MSLKREDAMVHAPDLLLLSQYDPKLGEVAAFEELIGSHGGLGGPQTEPFILHPVEWTLDEECRSAAAIYRNIRRWLDSIGIELGKPAASPAASTSSPPASPGADDRTPEPAPPPDRAKAPAIVGRSNAPATRHAPRTTMATRRPRLA